MKKQEDKLPVSRKLNLRFSVGEYVLIASMNTTFKRGFQKQWTEVLFKITSIQMAYSPFACVLENFGGQSIDGKFFVEQLQGVYFPELVKIKKIVKRQKEDNILEAMLPSN